MIEVHNNGAFFDFMHAHRDRLALRACGRQHSTDLERVGREFVFRNFLEGSGIDRTVTFFGFDRHFFLAAHGHARHFFF